MKIPLDFFLRLIQEMLNDLDCEDVAKKINKHFETPEDDYNDILDDVSLKEIILYYINANKDFKKKLKTKIKNIQKLKIRENEKEKESIEPNENNKKKEKEELLKKKKKRKNSKTSENSEKIRRKRKNTDDDIDLEKEVKFIPKPKSNSNPERLPYKRIDDSIINNLPKVLKDNSYNAFMKQTGDNYGKVANDRLMVTRGKDFKKEKTKFKNKTFFGGLKISQTVRSIPLEDDDSD